LIRSYYLDVPTWNAWQQVDVNNPDKTSVFLNVSTGLGRFAEASNSVIPTPKRRGRE
jgi:hypothetical protein